MATTLEKQPSALVPGAGSPVMGAVVSPAAAAVLLQQQQQQQQHQNGSADGGMGNVALTVRLIMQGKVRSMPKFAHLRQWQPDEVQSSLARWLRYFTQRGITVFMFAAFCHARSPSG